MFGKVYLYKVTNLYYYNKTGVGPKKTRSLSYHLSLPFIPLRRISKTQFYPNYNIHDSYAQGARSLRGEGTIVSRFYNVKNTIKTVTLACETKTLSVLELFLLTRTV